jgi:hypothetical protein
MKALRSLLALALLAGLGGVVATRWPSPAPVPVPAPASPTAAPPTTTLLDPVAVFQRAFWQRPSAADRILHAERREWATADGVQKWQWFLVVEPSPALVKHLREDNAFSTVPAATAPAVRDAPAWFTFQPAEVEVRQAAHGNLRMFFGKTKRLLYATDAGDGFLPGAPEPAKPAKPAPRASG